MENIDYEPLQRHGRLEYEAQSGSEVFFLFGEIFFGLTALRNKTSRKSVSMRAGYRDNFGSLTRKGCPPSVCMHGRSYSLPAQGIYWVKRFSDEPDRVLIRPRVTSVFSKLTLLGIFLRIYTVKFQNRSKSQRALNKLLYLQLCGIFQIEMSSKRIRDQNDSLFNTSVTVRLPTKSSRYEDEAMQEIEEQLDRQPPVNELNLTEVQIELLLESDGFSNPAKVSTPIHVSRDSSETSFNETVVKPPPGLAYLFDINKSLENFHVNSDTNTTTEGYFEPNIVLPSQLREIITDSDIGENSAGNSIFLSKPRGLMKFSFCLLEKKRLDNYNKSENSLRKSEEMAAKPSTGTETIDFDDNQPQPALETLQMAIAATDYPAKLISADDKKVIMELVRYAAIARRELDKGTVTDPNLMVNMGDSRMHSGQIMVICYNAFTMMWLNTVIREACAEGTIALGYNIKCVPRNFSTTVPTFALFCCNLESFEDIKQRLQLMRAINTRDWVLLNSKAQQKGDTRFTFASASFKAYADLNKRGKNNRVPVYFGDLATPILIDHIVKESQIGKLKPCVLSTCDLLLLNLQLQQRPSMLNRENNNASRPIVLNRLPSYLTPAHSTTSSGRQRRNNEAASISWAEFSNRASQIAGKQSTSKESFSQQKWSKTELIDCDPAYKRTIHIGFLYFSLAFLVSSN